MILGDKVIASVRPKEIDTATETRTGIDKGAGIHLHPPTVVVGHGAVAAFATRITNKGPRNLGSSSSRLHRVRGWATARERGCGPTHERTAAGVSVSKGRHR